MKNKFYILIFVFSCGFYSTKGSLPAHIDSIYITPIINESSEYLISNQLSDSISENLINENILSIKGQDFANSKLDIIILSVKDSPNTYSVGLEKQYDEVEEWKITIDCEVSWIDLDNNNVLFSNKIKGWGVYGTSSDISLDGIDNDGDNLIDNKDSDEFGPPREGAIRISIEKLSQQIINAITSTW